MIPALLPPSLSSNRTLEAAMAERNAGAKLRIYHTLYRLNLSFANIVAHCRALGESRVLTPSSRGSISPTRRNFRLKSTMRSSASWRALNPAICSVSAKCGSRGRKSCATRTTCSSMPKSAAGSWRGRARSRLGPGPQVGRNLNESSRDANRKLLLQKERLHDISVTFRPLSFYSLFSRSV